jgi:diphthamide synthase subunit DPH2
MRITICGSIAFYDKMLGVKEKLEGLGHEVELPPSEVKDENGEMIPVKEYYEKRKSETDDTSWIWERKEETMRMHFDKVEWSDAILVLNCDKKDIAGYIGANTLIEMGIALHLHKKIFLLNTVPEIDYKEEILGMRPTVINGDLVKIG